MSITSLKAAKIPKFRYVNLLVMTLFGNDFDEKVSK